MIVKFTPKSQKTSMERTFKPLSGPYFNGAGKLVIKAVPKEITTHDIKPGKLENEVITRELTFNAKIKRWELNLNKK